MTIEAWLQQATLKLTAAGIETARLDALVIAEDTLNKSRTHLLAYPNLNLTSVDIKVLNEQIGRRTQHEPLAYIRGVSEFYGRDFVVSPAVLEPRPESEAMIELLLGLPDAATARIADVGTGCGALGITASLELSNPTVDLLEISDEAMQIAQKNVIKYTTTLKIIQSDLLSSAPGNYDILLCNLPYVPDGYAINKAAMAEPKLAIFGGTDGMDLYRRLFSQIEELTKKPLYILTESLLPQHSLLSSIAEQAGYHQAQVQDFIQLFALA